MARRRGPLRKVTGVDEAVAAMRAGDTLVVLKLGRLARSVPDARMIADTLVARGVKLALGTSVYDPADHMGKMFFNILATLVEFEADLIRLRTREGMAIARARGKLRGKQPKLSEKQQREVHRMYDTGDYSISDLAELFSSLASPSTTPWRGRSPPHNVSGTPPFIAEKVTVEEHRNGGDLRQPSAVEPATEPPALEQFEGDLRSMRVSSARIDARLRRRLSEEATC